MTTALFVRVTRTVPGNKFYQFLFYKINYVIIMLQPGCERSSLW